MNNLTTETIALFLGDEVNDILLSSEELCSIGKIKVGLAGSLYALAKLPLTSGLGRRPKFNIPFSKALRAAILARIMEMGIKQKDIEEIEDKLVALFKTAKRALAINNRQMYRWSICEGVNYDVTLDLNDRGEFSVILNSLQAAKPTTQHIMVNITAILRSMYSCCLPTKNG
jgi:hypothetical protein